MTDIREELERAFNVWKNDATSFEILDVFKAGYLAALSTPAAKREEGLETLLNDVIAADQCSNHNNTMQDTKYDGPFATRARAILSRLSEAKPSDEAVRKLLDAALYSISCDDYEVQKQVAASIRKDLKALSASPQAAAAKP